MRKPQYLGLKNYDDLTNKKFGKLIVIAPLKQKLKSGQHKKWICKCECGNTTIVSSNHLKSGNIKSCGCYFHGLSNTRLFRIWADMKDRCNNPKRKGFEHYGGRNIKVCSEWENNFKAFYDWAISNGYADNLTIDRINNDGGYSPDNCRWVTKKVQANNTRINHRIVFNSVDHTIAEWSEITGIKANTILYRLRRGWTVERTLTQEVRR